MHSLHLSDSAQRALRNAPTEIRGEVERALSMLIQEPKPLAARRLPVSRDTYELSGAGFHLVYEVDLTVITVQSISVDRRCSPIPRPRKKSS